MKTRRINSLTTMMMTFPNPPPLYLFRQQFLQEAPPRNEARADAEVVGGAVVGEELHPRLDLA